MRETIVSERKRRRLRAAAEENPTLYLLPPTGSFIKKTFFVRVFIGSGSKACLPVLCFGLLPFLLWLMSFFLFFLS